MSANDPSRHPVTFDSGALIALERGDPRVRALSQVLAQDHIAILIPAPVIAEVWRGGTGRQALLARFLASGVKYGHIQILEMDLQVAKEIGLLLGRAPMSVTDAAVCRVALLTRGAVVTSDPDDIKQVIPHARVIVV